MTVKRTTAATAAMIAGLAGIGAGVPAHAAIEGDDISGIWVLQNYKPTPIPARQRIPQTIEGTPPPLNPAAAKVYEQRLAASDAGKPFDPPSAKCLTNGMPLMMMADTGYPFQIIQSPGQVTLLLQLWRDYRIIYLNREHHKDLEPGYMGDSVAHWEGKTLVVDTIGLNDTTVLDMTGMPHSEALHVVEHIRKLNRTTLEDRITIEDPETFTRPWTTLMTYKATEGPLAESLCENLRDFSTPFPGDPAKDTKTP